MSISVGTFVWFYAKYECNTRQIIPRYLELVMSVGNRYLFRCR